MKKQYRIKKNEEFQSIINKRQFISSNSFVVYYINKKEMYARVGISAPKKLGNAVTRNKIKRQVREMMNSFNLNQIKFDCVVIVRKEYLNKSFNENIKDLEKLLKQVKI